LALRIEQGPHRLCDGFGFQRLLAVARIPGLEQFHDPTTMGIVGFDGLNPLDRIAAG
jgi:hypothetical protein